MKDLRQFQELFHPLPGNRYLQVTTQIDETTEIFSRLMQEVGGRFHLALYEQKQNIPSHIEAKAQFLPDLKTPFRALPRDHDAVLLKDIFELHEDKEMLLRLCYLTLANAAHVIIM